MSNTIPTPEQVANNVVLRRVYAVRDDKQKEFNPPVIISNDAVASRTFGDMLNQDKNSIMYKHAGDFSLWYLGDFDVERGTFINHVGGAYIVCRASDFIEA